jgi:hypothetical protein
MGTYNITVGEIVLSFAEALDELEGDFTQKELFKALKKMKEYPYVCDKFIDDGKWDEYLCIEEAK